MNPKGTMSNTHPAWTLLLETPVVKPSGWYAVAKTLADAQRLIRAHGMPTTIDFDYWHDSRGVPKPGPSSYDLAQWIAERCVHYPEGFTVSSANVADREALERVFGIRRQKEVA